MEGGAEGGKREEEMEGEIWIILSYYYMRFISYCKIN